MIRLTSIELVLSDERVILKNIHYDIAEKDFVILLGSNGSGKSSLLKILYRQYFPSRGSVEFSGKALTRYSTKELAKDIAVLTQNCHESLFPGLTVKENVSLRLRHQWKETQIKNYLADYNANLASKLSQMVTSLSGGEKQALALALCFLNPPRLLLLDEHTSALDPKSSANLMRLTANKVAQYGITCVLTTHDLDIALGYGNRILMLKEGEVHRLIDQPVKSKLTKESLIQHYQ